MTASPDKPAGGELAIDPAATERILADFLRRELRRTGLRSYVVGLSGGVDSAVSAYLAARALGPDALRCILLPYRTSRPDSAGDARAMAGELGCGHETIDISPMVDGFVAAAGDPGRHRRGNVMARCRMLALYDRSFEHGALVLGTSNKTELLLGYGTIFGDMASAVNPIGDLYKTQVWALARHLGIPERVCAKAPSADLWPDQTDEAELGLDYATADRLLHLLVDMRVSPETACRRGFPRETVERVLGMVRRSQYKRMPPVIAKVSLRSIGWDFRYPRDWKS